MSEHVTIRGPSALVISMVAFVVLLLVLLPIVVMMTSTLQGDVMGRWSELDSVVLDRMVNTVVLALAVTVLSLLLGYPLAVCLHRSEFPGRRWVGFLYVAPLLIPPHIHGISWLRIFGNQGYLTSWFAARGIDLQVRAGVFEIGGEATFYPGATWMMTAAFWPLLALVVSAGLTQLDPRYEEAALVSVGRRRTLVGVTWKLLQSHTLTGAFFVFIFSLGCYGIPALLDTPTIMIEIFHQSRNVDNATAAVVAAPLVVLSVAALAWVTFFAGRRVLGGTEGARPTPASLRPRSWKAFTFCWGLLAVTAGWPFVSLLVKSGSLDTYRAVWSNVKPEIVNSLILSVAGSVVVGFGGTVVALCSVRLGRKRGFLMEALSLLPFAFPAVVVGVATNIFWSRFATVPWIDRFVYGGIGIALVTYLMLFLPFSMRSVKTALMRLSPGLTEAAEVGGRGGAATLFRIVLPLARPGIVAGMLLGFVLVLGELAAGLTVRPPDWMTVQVRIFNMIHFVRDEEVAALCVMVAVLALVPTALYALVFNKKVEVL